MQLPQGQAHEKPLLSPWRGRGRHSFFFRGMSWPRHNLGPFWPLLRDFGAYSKSGDRGDRRLLLAPQKHLRPTPRRVDGNSSCGSRDASLLNAFEWTWSRSDDWRPFWTLLCTSRIAEMQPEIQKMLSQEANAHAKHWFLTQQHDKATEQSRGGAFSAKATTARQGLQTKLHVYRTCSLADDCRERGLKGTCPMRGSFGH